MRHPLSLEAFTDWLATMPAEEEYNWYQTKDCGIHRYLKSIRMPVSETGGWSWFDHDHKEHAFPPGWENTMRPRPHTFGAALSRARELQRTAG